MRIYRNSINVLKGNHLGREVKIGTYAEGGANALFDINTIAYLDLLRIQMNLVDVLAGKFKYEYEWCGMRYCFESNSDFTTIEDTVFDSENMDVETDMINELIVNRINYLNALNKVVLMRKVKDGFDAIKLNPSDFRIEEFRYSIELPDEILFFLLFEEDLCMSSEEFMSTIKINDSFFRNDS